MTKPSYIYHLELIGLICEGKPIPEETKKYLTKYSDTFRVCRLERFLKSLELAESSEDESLQAQEQFLLWDKFEEILESLSLQEVQFWYHVFLKKFIPEIYEQKIKEIEGEAEIDFDPRFLAKSIENADKGRAETPLEKIIERVFKCMTWTSNAEKKLMRIKTKSQGNSLLINRIKYIDLKSPDEIRNLQNALIYNYQENKKTSSTGLEGSVRCLT